MAPTKLLEPIPPGEILMEEFMRPLGISIDMLARDLDVPSDWISDILEGTRPITPGTAIRLAFISVCRQSCG